MSYRLRPVKTREDREDREDTPEAREDREDTPEAREDREDECKKQVFQVYIIKIYLPVCLSVYPSTCLSVYLSMTFWLPFSAFSRSFRSCRQLRHRLGRLRFLLAKNRCSPSVIVKSRPQSIQEHTMSLTGLKSGSDLFPGSGISSSFPGSGLISGSSSFSAISTSSLTFNSYSLFSTQHPILALPC
jgi:hypothetical protein